MAFAGPPSRGDKPKPKPPFVRAAGHVQSEWKLVQGEGWDPARWAPFKQRLATRGAKYRDAPLAVEPVYSDPTERVTGSNGASELPASGGQLCDADMPAVWRAQIAERDDAAAQAKLADEAARGRHLRQHAAWAEAERSAEAWRKQQAVFDMRRGLDAQVAEKRRALRAAVREDVLHGMNASGGWGEGGASRDPTPRSSPLTVVRVHRGGPAPPVRGGGGYASGAAARGTCPLVERVTVQRRLREAHSMRSRVGESAGMGKGQGGGTAHGGHGGDHRLRRAYVDRGRFDSEGAVARARVETLDDQRGKFGWDDQYSER